MQFTYEASATIPMGPQAVLDHWSQADTLPRHLTHVRAIAEGDTDDVARLVIVLDGRHVEFVVQRTMCSETAVCWQNLGERLIYVLTVEAEPLDSVPSETRLKLTVSYDPPGFLPDIMESLGRNKSFRTALENDVKCYRDHFFVVASV